MQDEINSRVVAIAVNTGKEGARMTAHLLKEALRKYLAEQDRAKMKRVSKAQTNKVEKPICRQTESESDYRWRRILCVRHYLNQSVLFCQSLD